MTNTSEIWEIARSGDRMALRGLLSGADEEVRQHVAAAASELMLNDFPDLREIQSRGIFAKTNLLYVLYEATKNGTIESILEGSYEGSQAWLERMFSEGNVQVEVHNRLDPESSIGIGQAGPVFFLHDNVSKLITPEEVVDIRRGELARDPESRELWWLYLQEQDDAIRGIVEQAVTQYPL